MAKIKLNGVTTHEQCPGCFEFVDVLHGTINNEHCKLYWCQCDDGDGLLAIAPDCRCKNHASRPTPRGADRAMPEDNDGA